MTQLALPPGVAAHAAATTGPQGPRGGVPARLPLLVLRLAGSEEAMGEQHGRLLREHGGYETALRFYPTLPELLLLPRGKGLARTLVAGIGQPFKEWALARLARDRPEGFRARTRAYLHALGVPAGHARFFGITEVFQNAVGLAARRGLGPFAARTTRCASPPGCSTLVVWDAASHDGRLRHARNFDYPGIGVWDQAPMLVFCAPDDGALRYGFVTTRGADVPGVTGFNEAGLSLTAHTRFHTDFRWDGALVVDLGHEILRRAETIEDAVRIASARPIASTWGLCVSSARERRAVVLETTGAIVRSVEPSAAAPDQLTCANRYRHADTMRGEATLTCGWVEHSDQREERLCQIVADGRALGGLTPEDLQRALDDHVEPEARGLERASGMTVSNPSTVQSVVIEPEDRAIRLSIGAAPASRGPWVRLPWTWDGPVEARVMGWPSAFGAVDGAGAAGPADTADAPDAADAELAASSTRFRGGAPARALALFVEAARQDTVERNPREARRLLEEASHLDPDDPSHRFMAGALALAAGEAHAALAHFAGALALERAPFRRGLTALWASRAAHVAGDAPRARALRAEVLTTTDPRLAELRSAAREEAARPLTARRLRGLAPNFFFVDALV